LQGLEVPTYLTTNITVTPKLESSVLTTFFTGNYSSYRTGESIELTITTLDEYGNVCGTSDDYYFLTLIGQTSGISYGPFISTSLLNGTYTVVY
jgi:hypothetical protein